MTDRPTGRELALLGVGVLAVSLAVPPLAIAFWRNALGAAAVAPVALRTARRSRGGRRSPPGPTGGSPVPARTFAARRTRPALVVAAGLCLAAHFGFWVTSLTMTSVASATALVSLQVIWVVGYDLLRGASVAPPVVVGVLVATVGALVVTGVDFSLSARALAGDLLALVGSIAMAAYAVIGGRVRQTMSTSAYAFGCYATAALALLVATLIAGQPLTGYAAAQWLGLVVLTLTAQLLGHTVFNHLLATVSPTVVSLALLLEIPGAALIAAAWLGQVPTPAAFLGLALILAGIAAVVRSSRSDPADLWPA